MRASVVISNYNYEQYVADAIRSALAQSWEETEIIVVDDGSTDRSRRVIDQFSEDATVILQRNGGQTSAMNAGFAAATGDVVLFLDADDVLEPDALTAAAKRLCEGDYVKVHAPLRVVDAAGRATGDLLPSAPLPEGDLLAVALTEGPHALPFPPTSGNVWSRDLLSQVFPLPELEKELCIGSASADHLLSMLAVLSGPVAALATPLARYRLHGQNDYAGGSLVGRVQRHVRVLDAQLSHVEKFCRRRGLTVDVGAWRARSWFHRAAAVRDAIAASTPPGATVVFVDDLHFGADLDDARVLVPFVERDGTWWGAPADDDHARRELQRAVAGGATHLAVAWQCFWWLDAYPSLRERGRLLLTAPDAVVFALERGYEP